MITNNYFALGDPGDAAIASSTSLVRASASAHASARSAGRRSAAAPLESTQTRTYSQSAQGITLVMKTVGADGKEATTQTTYQFDGKDYPVTGAAEYDSLSAKQIDSNTAEFTLMKAGKTVGTTRRTVSKDGKTLTATAKNAKGEDTLVFNKQ